LTGACTVKTGIVTLSAANQIELIGQPDLLLSSSMDLFGTPFAAFAGAALEVRIMLQNQPPS
jgi:hypothetical protein